MRSSRCGARRSVLLGAVLTVGLLGIAPSAWAVPPTRFSDSDAGTFPIVNCGSFQVFDQSTLNLRGTEHYNSSGNPIRLDFHVWGTDRFFNPTNGKSFSGSFSQRASVDLVSGQEAVSGIAFRIVVPGSGAVLLDVGRVVFDPDNNVMFVAGPHQLLEGDVAEVCAALS